MVSSTRGTPFAIFVVFGGEEKEGAAHLICFCFLFFADIERYSELTGKRFVDNPTSIAEIPEDIGGHGEGEENEEQEVVVGREEEEEIVGIIDDHEF